MTLMDSVRKKIDSLFAFLERVTHINVRRSIKDLSWVYAGEAAGVAIALLLALAYSHFLSKETYGTYKYVLSIFGILTVFSLPGMSDAAQRAVAQGKEAIFWKTFQKRIQWATIGGLICAGIGIYYLWYGDVLLAATFLAASPFIVFIDGFTQYSALLIGRQLFRENTWYSVATTIGAGLIIFFTVLFSRNLVVIVVMYLFAFVLARGMALLHATKKFPPDPTKIDDGAVRYGAHISVINIINITVGQLDSILLWHFAGPIQLAIYAFAEAASDQALKAFKLVTTSMAFPKFSAMDRETMKKTLPRKILIAHAVTLPLAIILALIIPFVYTVLFPEYASSIPYAQILALLLTFTPLRFISTAVNAKASIKAIYSLSIFTSGLQALLLVIAIPLYGIWGIIFAEFLDSIVASAYGFYLLMTM